MYRRCLKKWKSIIFKSYVDNFLGLCMFPWNLSRNMHRWGPYPFITPLIIKLYKSIFISWLLNIKCVPQNANHTISISNNGWYIENISLGIARGKPGRVLGQGGPYPFKASGVSQFIYRFCFLVTWHICTTKCKL